MKNKSVIIAFVLIMATFIVVLALPADKESIEAENRVMSTVPPLDSDTVFSGEFASGFESFIGDNIGFRSFFTQLSKGIEDKKGFAPDTGTIISTNKDIGTGTTQKQTLLLLNNTIMEMFIRNPAQEQLYADAVNHYAESLPPNIKLYSMLIPTQLEFQEPMYKNLQDSQKDAIDSIYEKLDENVTTVDAYSALANHHDEYIYFRTDHHWTQLGAYYAYREFMDENGGAAVNKDDFEVNKIQNVLGYLYDRVDAPEIAATPDTIEWYDVDPDNRLEITIHIIDDNGKPAAHSGKMYDRTKANYMFFFGSDHPIVEMTNNDNPDGKTLVVLKESYSNVLAPWLIQSYHKVILVDPRIYTGKFQEVIDEYSPDDVFIVNYIFTTNFPDYCNMMKNMY
ncbi:MAG: DHHW family protein [Hominilimicola sp.]